MHIKITITLIAVFLWGNFTLSSFPLSTKAKSFTLPNGMTFLVYQRRQVPNFAGMILVKIGSVDEKKGQTGLAHFFEHMAFKGTTIIGTRDYQKEKTIIDQMERIEALLEEENRKDKAPNQTRVKELQNQLSNLYNEQSKYIIPGEMTGIYSENGAESLNATTDCDTTRYFVKLPSNRLELWFCMESERFEHPVLREFYTERDVVMEEKRLETENSPEGYLFDTFFKEAFTIHPYRNPVVGNIEDIRDYTMNKAMVFFRTYYVPQNMTAALVGDVDFEEVKRLAEKYFGDIPPGEFPGEPGIIEPLQLKEKRFILHYEGEPVLLAGYHIPAYPHPDNVIMFVIANILSQGDSSRLNRELVFQKKMAAAIDTVYNSPGIRYPSLFMIYAKPRSPYTVVQLEEEVYKSLERLKTEPVSQQEIETVINRYEAGYYLGMKENLVIAERLLEGKVLFNDPDVDFKRLSIIKQVKPKQIMETAQRIFVENNRTVGILHRHTPGD